MSEIISETIRGIDVSEHNGTLDWAKIRDAGIGFAMLRSGYGVSHEDSQFRANVRGCIANGIPFGIYHFSYALTEAGARKEADFCASLLEPWKDQVCLPVFYDLEYDSVRYAKEHGVTINRSLCTALNAAFTGRITELGYVAGIYFNLDYRQRLLDLTQLQGCELWYANWNKGTSWKDYDIWQYGSDLLIAGHSCRFDANLTTRSWLNFYLQKTSGSGSVETAENAENTAEVINTPASDEEEWDMKIWTNGSTREPVYADTAKRTRIGSLSPRESCDCLGRAGSMYIVRYQVDGTGTMKVGMVAYSGGVA